MIYQEKNESQAINTPKSVWSKPIVVTISKELLEKYIQVAANSNSGGCLNNINAR